MEQRFTVLIGYMRVQVAGPNAARLALQQVLKQRDCLARSRVANPAIGGHARQALGRGQHGQVTCFRPEVRHVHDPVTTVR
jgi:hypothetical protein